ncbi:MAG: hypothetical protein FJ125_09995, partial [Deltaproteobacteria bacterium]|nr:hypothetical protein [Deltaproteobacteria bacterium]
MEPGSWVCRCCAYRAIPGLPRPLLCPDDGLPLVPQETAERHPEDLLLGTILDGRYAVVDILPVRGPARIYQALQLPGKQEISVHAPPPDEPEHIVERRRFADIAAQLADHRHPGLLGLLDHGWLEERGGYVVTEPYRGTTLAEWAKGGGRPSSWAAALAMAVPCIEALVAPHERGLVHGAVNPSRLLLEEQPPAGAGKEGGPLRLRLMGLGLEQLFPPRRKMSHDVAALRIN